MSNKKYLIGIIFLSLLIFSAYSTKIYAQEQTINGRIEKLNENIIILNGQSFQLSKEPLIIFIHANGSEFINNPELIPPNTSARCTFNNMNKITGIIIFSSRFNEPYEFGSKQLFNFSETIDNFSVSPDENYLAFYLSEAGLLKIVNLHNKETIWQTITSVPVFTWVPGTNNLLTYLKVNETGAKLVNLDLSTLAEKDLLKLSQDNYLIKDLWWSPLGNYLAFLNILGLKDAHGYSQLKLINKDGVYENLVINDVIDISWSTDEGKIVYSKYINDDFSNSKIELCKIDGEIIPLTITGNLPATPLWAKDNTIIYSSFKELMQEIFFYDFINNRQELILEDLKYLNNFYWLGDEELVFTTGYIPEIVIFNIKSKCFKVVNQGYLLQVLHNNIYYLKNNENNQQTVLYKYLKGN